MLTEDRYCLACCGVPVIVVDCTFLASCKCSLFLAVTTVEQDILKCHASWCFQIARCLYLNRPLSFSLFSFSTCGSSLLCFEADLNRRLTFLISNTFAASLFNILVWFNLMNQFFSNLRFEGTDIVARIVMAFLHPFQQIPWNILWLLYTTLFPFKIILPFDMVSPAVC